MSGIAQLNAAWRASQGQVEAFMNATALVPVIVVDGVVDEVAAFFRDDPEVERLYDALRAPEVVGYVEGRSALCFENNADFRKSLTSPKPDPRDVYRGFVRHWLAAVMQAEYPGHYKRLPSQFRVGGPLPMHSA